ncbi:MAG: signal peptide peptidase SppA, partial [Aquificaceae bacterium]|nr:signal peptide peptidase SppA [Aquificaceae bacterium]
ELGLVDELGNLQDAINRAKKLANVPDARVFYMEERKGFFRRLLEEDFQGFTNHYTFMLYYMMK